MLLNRRANCCPAQSGVYRNLRTLVRHRKKLVKMKTEVRNRIHTIVDRLFPGFLNEKKSGIIPFSSSSLYLMQARFSAPQIRRRQRPALIRNLEKRGTKKVEQVAAKLQQYAAQVLATPEEYSATLQISLASHVTHYRCLFDSAQQLVKEMAQLLAQTQGAFLTSILKASALFWLRALLLRSAILLRNDRRIKWHRMPASYPRSNKLVAVRGHR